MDLKNYLDSEEKWEKICEKVKARELFYGHYGFARVEVVESCGYCKEFRLLDSESCNPCPLTVSGFCEYEYESLAGLRSVFWRFVDVMRVLSGRPSDGTLRYRTYSKERLWKMADELSAKMLKRIRQDDPRKPKLPEHRKLRKPFKQATK